MYTGNVWGIALLIAGFLATLIAFQLLMQAVFPAIAARTGDALRRRTVAAVALGVPVLAGTVLLAAVAFSVFGQLGGPGKLMNAAIAAALQFPLVMGLAAVSRFVGERMPSPADAGRPWRATLRGGVTCGLAFTTPVVGWFLILPVAVAAGFGAVTLGLFAPARPAGASPLPSEAGAGA